MHVKQIAYFPLILLFALVMVGAGCSQADVSDEDTDPVIDRDAILQEAMDNGLIMNPEETNSMVNAVSEDATSIDGNMDPAAMDFTGWFSGGLADVTGGGAYGLARATFENGQYKLVVTTGGLTEPSDDYFYEGWVVRRGDDLSVISTGELEVIDGEYVNTYMSATDLTDHDFYVLTLEPNDGDPAPAEHILEGTLK
jgi:hypothetical protein